MCVLVARRLERNVDDGDEEGGSVLFANSHTERDQEDATFSSLVGEKKEEERRKEEGKVRDKPHKTT